MEIKAHLAVDIGASGGRHILGWLDGGELNIEEIHRFPNGMQQRDGGLYWDVEAIFSEIVLGLKKCAEAGKIPVSVGIDTWGVDFVLVDKSGSPVAPAVAYRDSRTGGMDAEVGKYISESELYARAGIQKMLINTVYQLMAIKKNSESTLKSAAHLLMMPDYLHYRLSGVMKNEYTIATTGALVNSLSKTWDDEIIRRLGFPREIFGEIVPAGTVLGGFTDEIKNAVGFDCTVIMPPSHDTASAFLAVPTKSDRSVYISSGTWSLMGVELKSPITNEISRIANLTNEGGYNYRYRYLKNIAGLWLLQCVRKEIGDGVGYAELVAMARKSGCDSVFDVNDERFTAPESMVGAISDVCREAAQTVPQSLGDFARSIFRSLAVSYANTAKDLEALTGTVFDSINIIGGGSQNEFLNELTVLATGLPVYAGPAEGTALGSIAAQMISMGVLPDLDAARKVIRNSFEIKLYR